MKFVNDVKHFTLSVGHIVTETALQQNEIRVCFRCHSGWKSLLGDFQRVNQTQLVCFPIEAYTLLMLISI
jgi:hypothetical protein